MPKLVKIAERHRDAGAIRVPMPDGRTPIFVCNADLAEDLVDEARFEKVLDGPLLHLRAFAGDGLFTAHPDEPNWHIANRVISPGFSSPSIERYFPAMTQSLDALLTSWRQTTQPVDVLTDMTKLTLDTISLAGFGYEFDSFSRAELHPFLRALARALQESIDALRRPVALAPLFRRAQAQYRADIAEMFALVDEVIRERKRRPQETWPRDFLSLMLENADPKTGQRLSDENIRYQILTFLIAGHETTASLLAFVLHKLARDRALFLELREEIDAVLGPQGSDHEPTMKQILALDRVRRTLSEGLRLWPTVPIVTRAAKADTTLGGRWEAPKGQMFGLLLSSIHTDPTVWPDPHRFDPNRFLPEAVKARPSWAYKPFGIGRRSCTGKHFALVEASLCLARLVQEFDFVDPGPLALSPTLVPKPKGFLLRLRKRAR